METGPLAEPGRLGLGSHTDRRAYTSHLLPLSLRLRRWSPLQPGDREYALANTTREFDLHMGTDGANLHCVDCRYGENHRVRGRGVDLLGTDMPAKPLSCDDGSCHHARPHAAEVLHFHARRVACQTCHIPTLAQQDPTDMRRHWSRPAYDPDKDRWSATSHPEKEVQPVYGWYTGPS
ncbi:MAG: hypothetical protein NZ869_09920 [Thermoanaerobaculum sp.]|nr:hypothetical protein [Thermoanaerobaculum sp.]MDW7967145.1 hypothetical protein [Thermoanaerobaculum sp.]